jgi:hypothetical protein
MHFIVVDFKIVFEIFEVVPIFRGKFLFWSGEFFCIQGTGNLSVCSGIIVSGLVMIFMWSDILYLNDIDCKFLCECEMLRDDEKRRRIELEGMFEVDFGGQGERRLGLV